jgi:hypothetical protein
MECSADEFRKRGSHCQGRIRSKEIQDGVLKPITVRKSERDTEHWEITKLASDLLAFNARIRSDRTVRGQSMDRPIAGSFFLRSMNMFKDLNCSAYRSVRSETTTYRSVVREGGAVLRGRSYSSCRLVCPAHHRIGSVLPGRLLEAYPRAAELFDAT